MELKTGYSQIWKISFPIMLGSAAQNVITLTDNIFLSHYHPLHFAAIGMIGAFYLIIASIGYGFSRGGQIFIARKFGEQAYKEIGVYFQALLLFEILIASILYFLLLHFSVPFLKLFISSTEILTLCNEYLQYRIPGIFFSYIGVVIIALYTGVARTVFILVDTIILILANVILNYCLVFGVFGFESMGIKGSALASTIAEAIALVCFILYMVLDKENRKYGLFDFRLSSSQKIKDCFFISFPIVVQSALGLIAYFLFFTFIENKSSKELQISNLIRTTYLILSIPTWGFSAGINSIVSSFIGNRKRLAVIPMILRTCIVSLATTLLITLPFVAFPEIFLYPLFGSDEHNLIAESKPYMIILLPILFIFSIGSVYINGLTGTGHTKTALGIQSIFTIGYLIFAFITIKVFKMNLYWAWSAEVFYWAGITIYVYYYLRSKKWHQKKF